MKGVTEQSTVISNGNGFIFKHYRGRTLARHEVELFVDLPEFKSEPDEPSCTFFLKAVPQSAYKLHNLSDREVAIVFNEEMAQKLNKQEVEIRITPVDEDSDVVISRNLKANLHEVARAMDAVRRELKKIRIKANEAKRSRKKVHVKGNRVPLGKNAASDPAG